jgi:hypothetical protein
MGAQPIQAVAMLQKATQLDPNYPDAWVFLSMAHGGLGETQHEMEDLKRAFALKEKALGWEKQRIEAMYYLDVTGEVYKAIDAFRTWASLEPNVFPPHKFLGFTYADIGLYQKADEELRLAMAATPNFFVPYESLSVVLRAEGKYDQADAMIRVAQDKKLAGPWLHMSLYELALLQGDAGRLRREQEWMAQNSEDPLVVRTQSQIDLLAGHLERARQRTQHAVNMALESNLKESAAEMLLSQATAEALVGESAEARHTIAAAMKLADSKDKKSKAALAMALNGEGAEAQRIMARLLRKNSSDTFLNAVDAPEVQAASQLRDGHAEDALRALESVKPFEFGLYAGLLPNYLRAMAYLQLRNARDAITEFQAVLDHRGVSPMSTVWGLSQLGLARAYAMSGDTDKARAAYQDFLTLWKDADPDIPVLKQAKAEYTELK